MTTKDRQTSTSGAPVGRDESLADLVVGLVGELLVLADRVVVAERVLDGVLVGSGVGSGVGLGLARRVASAENRAGDAEFRYARLRGRRLVRVGLAAGVGSGVGRVAGFPGRVRAALVREPDPVAPAVVEPQQVLGELFPVRGVLGVGAEPDYPYLRVAHVGPVVTFGSVAPHHGVGSVDDVDALLEFSVDVLMVEPGDGVQVPAFLVDAAQRVIDAGGAVVVFARTVDDLDIDVCGVASTVLTDDVRVAEKGVERFGNRVMYVAPFVDDTVYNPIGWQRAPDDLSAAVFVPVTKPVSDHDVLAELISSHGTVYRLGDGAVTDAQSYCAVAKSHPVAVVDPSHFVSEAVFLGHLVRLVACGVPVITVASPHLDDVFPDERLVLAVDSPVEALGAYQRLLDDPVERERHSIRARQWVLEHRTARVVFDQLLERHGIPVLPAPVVSILLVTKRPDYLGHAIEQIRSQGYPAIELITVLHGDGFDVDAYQTLTGTCGFPTTTVQEPSTATFGDCLNTAVDLATGDLVTKMDDDDYYGPNHLQDLVTAFHYSQTDVTGKRANFTIFEKPGMFGMYDGKWTEIASRHLPGATMLVRASLIEHFRFGRVNRGIDSDLLLRAEAAGAVMYSTHPFNFVRVRHGDHTYAKTDAEFLDKTELLDGMPAPSELWV